MKGLVVHHFRAFHALQKVCIYVFYVAVVVLCGVGLYSNTGLNSITLSNNHQLLISFKNFETPYIVEPPPKDICEGVHTVILIPSRPNGGGIDTRNVLRDSWLHPDRIPPGFLHMFVIGVPTEAYKFRTNMYLQMLAEENKTYKDIILYNLNDTYADLYLKTYILMEWQQEFCPQAKYLLKADDDNAIFLPRLNIYRKKVLDKIVRKNPLVAFGFPLQGSPVRDKNSKWYVSEDEYQPETFPDYVNGATYILTSAAVKKILSFTRTANILHVEDVLFTGVLAEKAGVQRIGVDIFVSVLQWHTRCYKHVPHVTGVFGLPTGDITTYTSWIDTIQCGDNKTTTIFCDPKDPTITYDPFAKPIATPKQLVTTTVTF